jgi:hypothetical protein
MADAQTVGVLVTAASVTVAAIYYIFTLKMNMRTQELALKTQQQNLETRRVGLMDSILTRSINYESMKSIFELLRYEWSDYGDFERKYGSENNVEAAARRYAVWNAYDTLGMMLRRGMVEMDDIYRAGSQCLYIWVKYKPIIEENRRRYNGQSYLRDFEYLYEEMMKAKLSRDPSYRVPENLDKYVPDK